MPWPSYAPKFPFNRSAIETNAPEESGVYGYWTDEEWVFIGDSDNIREALLDVQSAVSGKQSLTGFTYELWPPEVRRVKAWNLIVDLQPALNTEHKHCSNELFHFVGYGHPTDRKLNYETLQTILRERQLKKRWPGDPRLVSMQFDPAETLKRGELMVSNVVCFCDIRPGELKIHVSKYGEFGLSFHRGLLIRYNTRPVIYVPCYLDDWQSIGGATLIRDILAVYESYNELVIKELPDREYSRPLGRRIDDKQVAKEAIASTYEKDFMAFIKAYDAMLPEADLQQFFMEREWRKFGSFQFEAEQVVNVLVAGDYVEQAKADLPEYENRIKDVSEYL